jgi:hypothetical protein
MKTIGRRLCRLEDRFAPRDKPRERYRMVVRSWGPEEGLQNATSKRTLCANGLLMEVVRLNGSGDGLTDQDLEGFVESFPIG